MPAGVPWATYLKMFAASLLAMCAGAQAVHRYYQPDLVSARAAAASLPNRPRLRAAAEMIGTRSLEHLCPGP